MKNGFPQLFQRKIGVQNASICENGFALISKTRNCVAHARDLRHFAHVVNAHNVGAVGDCQRDRGRGSPNAIFAVCVVIEYSIVACAVQNAPNRRLAAGRGKRRKLEIVACRNRACRNRDNSRPRRTICKFSSIDFPNPKPASRAIRSRAIPNFVAASMRSRQNFKTSAMMSFSFCAFAAAWLASIVCEIPRRCIKTIPQSLCAKSGNISASCVAPETSLMMLAPASRAHRATPLFVVSTESGIWTRAASFSRSGRTRRVSSSLETSLAPGRVLSPPMSRMSAPSSTSCNARSTTKSSTRFDAPPNVKPSLIKPSPKTNRA